MNSSSDDELPDIPGTQYPWMEDGATSSSRSSRKEKEKNIYKGPKMKKRKPTMMDTSSDDDFMDTQPGSSNTSKKITPKPAAAELKRLKKKEYNERYRENLSAEKQEEERLKTVQRKAAAKANETPLQQQQRKINDAARKATERAAETPEQHMQRNQANAQQTAAARANETPQEHLQRNRANAERDAARRANYSPQRSSKEHLRSCVWKTLWTPLGRWMSNVNTVVLSSSPSQSICQGLCPDY